MIKIYRLHLMFNLKISEVCRCLPPMDAESRGQEIEGAIVLLLQRSCRVAFYLCLFVLLCVSGWLCFAFLMPGSCRNRFSVSACQSLSVCVGLSWSVSLSHCSCACMDPLVC